MNCPVCDKVLNPNLSICTSCGAMRDDDVREEIMGSVIHVRKPLTIELEEIAEPAKISEPHIEPDEMVLDIEDEELVIDISEIPDMKADDESETQELSLDSIDTDPLSLPLFDKVSEVEQEVVEPSSESEIEKEVMMVEVLPMEEVSEAVADQPTESLVSVSPEPARQPAKARVTAPIAGRDTGKLVIEFQNKKSEEPEWKSNLRNRLRSNKTNSDAISDESTVEILKTGTSDAIASSQTGGLDNRGESDQQPVSNSAAPSLIRERALRRIEDSRRRFGLGGGTTQSTGGGSYENEPISEEVPEKLLVVETTDTEPQERNSTGEITPPGKPKVKIRLVPNPQATHSTNRLDSEEVDQRGEGIPSNQPTSASKNDATPSIRIVVEPATSGIEQTKEIDPELQSDDDLEEELLQPGLPIVDETDDDDEEEFEYEEEEEYEEEISDLAPLGQRFNAGLFDMLICAFAALLILAPYIAMGGEILSSSGLLLFFVASSITTIVYQTLSIGLKGKTFGMRLFALEVIDIEENEYPTIAQALGSSLLFVLSLIFLGLGFVPMLFSPERRAIHDLASGTLMVREY